MKEFEVTLTAVSRKTFRVSGDTQEAVLNLVENLLGNSDLLRFSDEDVDSVDITCEEQCGGVCELCGKEERCPYESEDEEEAEDDFLFSK